MGDQIGAMARQMAQKADLTTPNDSTRKSRIQYVLNTMSHSSIVNAIKALANMPQVQEPTDSTTREITWPGMSGYADDNGALVGHYEEDWSVHYEGDQGYHNEGEVPKEK